MNRLLPTFLGCAALAFLASCGARPPAAPPEEKEVRAFLERYFATWSAQDMEGYAGCFHETARITWLSGEGKPHTDTLSDFLHGQRLGHQTSPEPMRETADHIEILMDDRAALARVRWTLHKGAQRTTGIDHFSLIRTPSGWRIAHLLFYSDP